MSIVSSIVQGVIGGAVTPFFTWLNKREDTQLEKYRVDGKVNVEALIQDTKTVEALVRLAEKRSEDPVDRMGRRFFLYPTGVWYTAIVVDSLLHKWLNYAYRVEDLPPHLHYIPYTVVGYLFIKLIKK